MKHLGVYCLTRNFKPMMKKLGFVFLLGLLISFPSHSLWADGLKDTVIEGWSLERFEHGKKIFSLQADKATFANKRLGFFELGLSKVILLENAVLIIYDHGAAVKTQQLKQAVYEINTKRLLDSNGNVVFSRSPLNTPLVELH